MPKRDEKKEEMRARMAEAGKRFFEANSAFIGSDDDDEKETALDSAKKEYIELRDAFFGQYPEESEQRISDEDWGAILAGFPPLPPLPQGSPPRPPSPPPQASPLVQPGSLPPRPPSPQVPPPSQPVFPPPPPPPIPGFLQPAASTPGSPAPTGSAAASPTSSYSSKGPEAKPLVDAYTKQFSDTSKFPFYKEPKPRQDGSVVLQFGDATQATDFFKEQAKAGERFLCVEEGKSPQEATHIFSFGDGNVYEGKVDEVKAQLKQASAAAQGNPTKQGEILQALDQFTKHTSSTVAFKNMLPAASTTPTPPVVPPTVAPGK